VRADVLFIVVLAALTPPTFLLGRRLGKWSMRKWPPKR
jgi:hypothetical protein